MTIETKYNIGDEAWVRSLGKPILVKVRYILITIIEEGVKIDYRCSQISELKPSVMYNTLVIKENLLFPTKEELLKSL